MAPPVAQAVRVEEFSGGRDRRRVHRIQPPGGWAEWAAPTLIVANAVAFFLLRPGVSDLWAARARASAASSGVGLTYWFGWFGGGSTPGNYSVLTPQLCAWIGTELVGSLSAVAIVLLCRPLLRGSTHPVAGSIVAAVGVSANLWSGRIPFLLGTVFMVAALVAVRGRRSTVAAVCGALSVFGSPVAGAFLALGLAGALCSPTARSYRRAGIAAIGTVTAAMALVWVVFGNPGNQHFSVGLCLEMIGGVLLCLLVAPARLVRSALWLSILAAVLVCVIPNGLGSNLLRWAWFVAPAAAIATTSRRLRVAVPLVAVMIGASWQTTYVDLHAASGFDATAAYYQPLADELNQLPDLDAYRVEVAAATSHVGDETLIRYAMLARGWETQVDRQLDPLLANKRPLAPGSYRAWLDQNAVGYVAVPRRYIDLTQPEYDLVARKTPTYLRLVWQSSNWQLFRVQDPSPIAAAPAVVVARTQARLTVLVPCACTVLVRVRWSKFLEALSAAHGTRGTVRNDGSGWSLLTTPAPGTYYLQGGFSGLFG